MSLYIITNLIFIFENCEFNLLSWILHPYHLGKTIYCPTLFELKTESIVMFCGCQMLVEHVTMMKYAYGYSAGNLLEITS